jgi:Mor family transcriptional regulator
VPRPSPISLPERSRIVARYTAGASVNSLAQDYGCSWTAIANIVREQGVFRGHKHRGGFTRQEEDDIVRRYGEGVRAGVLAREYGCSYQPINRILKERGAFESNRLRVGTRYNKQQVRDMVREYNEGSSIYAVARRFGGSPNGVWKVLRAHGVKFRDNAWQGGRVREYGGKYVGVYIAKNDPLISMARSTGYVLEHRLVMARQLGRPLTSKETVHHINGDTLDNRPENLQLRNGNHGKGAKFVCLDCGSHNVAASEI